MLLQCDGSKPSCYQCQQKGISTCHYRTRSTESTDAGLLSEAIGLLDSMTPFQAEAALAAVRGLDQDSDIIASLRDHASASEQDSDDTTGTLSDLSRLLGRVHPVSYPNIEPLNPKKKQDKEQQQQQQKQKQQRGRENMSYPIYAHPVRAMSAH